MRKTNEAFIFKKKWIKPNHSPGGTGGDAHKLERDVIQITHPENLIMQTKEDLNVFDVSLWFSSNVLGKA